MGRRLTALQPSAFDVLDRQAAGQALEFQDGLVMGESPGVNEMPRFAHAGAEGSARQLMQFAVQPTAAVNRTYYLVGHRAENATYAWAAKQ